MINKKLIHFKTKAGFESEKENIKDTSIVFIKETQEIWTHGQFYDCQSKDLENFITKSELKDFIKKSDLENYYTSEHIDELLDNYQEKGDYALSSDLEDYQPKGNYLTSEDLPEVGECVLERGTGGIQMEDCDASGSLSVSFGDSTTASGSASFAMGNTCHAEGDYSVSFGSESYATGNYSFATGENSSASGTFSVSLGGYNKSKNDSEFSAGYGNVSTKNSDTFGDSENTLFSIGNGEYNEYGENPHNAFEIKQNGDIYIPNTSSSGNYYNYPMIKLQDISEVVKTTEGGYILRNSDCEASARDSMAIGSRTVASNTYEFACGIDNDSQEDTLFSIGNGQDPQKHNAFEVKQNGDIYIVDTDSIGDSNFTEYNAPTVKLQNCLLEQLVIYDPDFKINESTTLKLDNTTFNKQISDKINSGKMLVFVTNSDPRSHVFGDNKYQIISPKCYSTNVIGYKLESGIIFNCTSDNIQILQLSTDGIGFCSIKRHKIGTLGTIS